MFQMLLDNLHKAKETNLNVKKKPLNQGSFT